MICRWVRLRHTPHLSSLCLFSTTVSYCPGCDCLSPLDRTLRSEYLYPVTQLRLRFWLFTKKLCPGLPDTELLCHSRIRTAQPKVKLCNPEEIYHPLTFQLPQQKQQGSKLEKLQRPSQFQMSYDSEVFVLPLRGREGRRKKQLAHPPPPLPSHASFFWANPLPSQILRYLWILFRIRN